MRVVWLATALGVASFAACSDTPAVESDGGSDVVVVDSPVADAASEGADAEDAQDEADAPIPCGITTVWTSDVPNDLACTGLYTNFATKTVDPSAMPYTPGLILWSDGATKQRWLYLPPNSKIDDSNMDEWVFPVGTKVWKEFQVSNVRIETRLYTKAQDGSWLWATYQWNQGETTATRVDDGVTNVVGTYEIPKHYDCDSCHAGRSDKLMGVEAIALSLAGAQGVTLDWLAKNDKLTVVPSNTTGALPEDSTGDAASALGFLHIDCGVSCHNQNGSAHASSSGFWARLPAAGVLAGTAVVTSVDAYTTAANMTPTGASYSTYANQGYKRLSPGDSSKSLIVAVANTRGVGQMPPIATHVVDTASVTALSTWIDAL